MGGHSRTDGQHHWRYAMSLIILYFYIGMYACWCVDGRRSDKWIGRVNQLTNHLFAEGQNRWGADLASLNMQRGRDHGLPSYNAYRGYCGLPRARHWDDLAGVFTNDTLQRYVKIYATPDDIDLWSAGISERPSPGSMVGPVFGCIMGEAFRNLRYGDRFWYENGGWPSSFTLGNSIFSRPSLSSSTNPVTDSSYNDRH